MIGPGHDAATKESPVINGFKRAVAASEPQFGIWSSLTSNLLAEILGDVGFIGFSLTQSTHQMIFSN